MSDLAIDVQHVIKRYDDHVAVKDLSLQVPRGTVYGLLGPNGAGKTTTIRMIEAPDVPRACAVGAAVVTLGTPITPALRSSRASPSGQSTR